MPDYLSQPLMPPPVSTSDESFAFLPTQLQAQTSNAENGHASEGIESSQDGFHDGLSWLGGRTTTNDHFHTAKRSLPEGSIGEDAPRQHRSNSVSAGIRTSSHQPTGMAENDSSNATTTRSSEHTGDRSTNTSVSPIEREKFHHPSIAVKPNTRAPVQSAQEAFADGLSLSEQQVSELIDIFFGDYHHFLPCIHRKSFVRRLKLGGSTHLNPLLMAIFAIAASSHPDHQVQALQQSCLLRANHLFDKDLNINTLPTQSLQAAAWIVFYAYISGNLTEAWFFLGKACRLAHFLGFDRLDYARSERLISTAPRTRDAIELEERRKTIWTLFLLDRSLSCLAGFSLAIDDRHFHVNFPTDDEQFQNFEHAVSRMHDLLLLHPKMWLPIHCSCYSQLGADSSSRAPLHLNISDPAPISSANMLQDQLSQLPSESFTTDLSTLISVTAIRNVDAKSSYNHILRASVLLGRIMTLHSHLHISQQRMEYATEFENLDNAVSLFSFILSRNQREPRERCATESLLNLWLMAMVQTCDMLLHHPGATVTIRRGRSTP